MKGRSRNINKFCYFLLFFYSGFNFVKQWVGECSYFEKLWVQFQIKVKGQYNFKKPRGGSFQFSYCRVKVHLRYVAIA